MVTGLSVELFVEQEEYIRELSNAAGIRILVHNDTRMPFPEDEGFSVAPGVKTSIGIKLVCIHNIYVERGWPNG